MPNDFSLRLVRETLHLFLFLFYFFLKTRVISPKYKFRTVHSLTHIHVIYVCICINTDIMMFP